MNEIGLPLCQMVKKGMQFLWIIMDIATAFISSINGLYCSYANVVYPIKLHMATQQKTFKFIQQKTILRIIFSISI